MSFLSEVTSMTETKGFIPLRNEAEKSNANLLQHKENQGASNFGRPSPTETVG